MSGSVPRIPLSESERLEERMASGRRLSVAGVPQRPLGLAHDLPAQLSSLIGRERDLEELNETMQRSRLVTLTGAGGVGKTRLAVEAAALSPAAFPDGVWWIELTSLAEPGRVGSSILQALGVRPLPGQSELEAATGFLGARQALLVVNNCEHLVDEVARVAEALLRACASLSLLATSRVPLGIVGETRWRVPGLSERDGVQLFIDRASRIDRSRQLSGDNSPAISEICRQLDGIPLALELAAARVTVLSPEAIAHGLGDALGLLTTRSPTTDPRHETLRASLDWSYGPLPAEAQMLLRRLGIFAGGATLELIQAVCSGEGLPAGRILESLETLVEHSLVQIEVGDKTVRYRLLETVRQYALERLREGGEREPMRDRHRDELLRLAERQRLEALTPRQPEVFAALDAEAANLAAALAWALETDSEKALRLCLALDFWYRARARNREADDAYERAVASSDPPPALHARALAAWAWTVGSAGDFGRANELAAEAAARAEASEDDAAIAYTLFVLANHRFFTDPVGALDLLHRCRELGPAVGDDFIVGRTEVLLGGVAWFQQHEEVCRAAFDELLPLLERLGDRETLGWFWIEQGAVRYALGEHAEAADLLSRAVAAAAEIGEATADRGARAYLALIDVATGGAPDALERIQDIRAQTLSHGGSFALPWLELFMGLAEAACDRLEDARSRLATLVEMDAWGAAHASAWARAELAELLRLLGEHGEVKVHAKRALDQARQLDNLWLAAKAQLTLGRLALRREEERSEAEGLLHQALGTICERGFGLELPRALEALAEAAALLGGEADAARILGAAERARRELGFVAWPAERAAVADLAARLAEVIGQEAFDCALSEGAELERGEAVGWLRRMRGARERPAHGWESLTPTELEVVRHAAAGLTNPQIGERLFIARATVKAHLSNVYAKLGVRNRAELAAKAAGRLPAREE